MQMSHQAGLTSVRDSSGLADPPSRPGHREDPRTVESNRFVIGVTWVDGELSHATWE